MVHEFKGSSVEEVVEKAVGQQQAKYFNQCDHLRSQVERRLLELKDSEDRLAFLERELQRLSDDIKRDKESFDNDDVDHVLSVAIALLSLIPAVRAIRLGIGAFQAGVSIARAIRNGQNITESVGAVIGGAIGINLLSSPSPRRQMQQLLEDIKQQTEKVDRLNNLVVEALTEWERNGCGDRLVI